MTYFFTVKKSPNASKTEFIRAFNCAVESIKSILYEYDLIVSPDLPYINILPSEKLAPNIPISLNECSNLIKEAFIDINSCTYPEFLIIEPNVLRT